MLPPLAAAPPGLPSAPLSYESLAVTISGLPSSPAPIAVAAPSSDADPSVSTPPHSALSSTLSSVSLPPAR